MPNEAGAGETPDITFLKHRFPFLMVDRVLSWEKGKELRTVKNISVNDVPMPGHFPGHPLFPGVLIIESFAQNASILVRLTEGRSEEGVLDALGAVLDFRFMKPVVPGDRLEVRILLTKTVGTSRLFDGKATVDGQEVASGRISLGKLRVP